MVYWIITTTIVTLLEPIRCHRCNTINEPTAKVCYNCSLILDKKFALELSKKEEEAKKAQMIRLGC